jgi:beta-barrel assembly-enhancing protease
LRRCNRFARPEIAIPRLIVLTMIVFVGAVGCGELAQVNIISTEEELQLGKEFSQEIEKGQIKLYEDPEVNAYIDSLGQLLARNSDRNDIPYIIKVVDTDEVNAFAVPGGYLYVNRGLITTAENESELAGVMGHEIGHIVGRHSAKQITRQYGLGMIGSILLGNNPNQLAAMAANIAGSGTLLKYGRDAELEADSYGVDETYRSGIDPEGMATFFEKLLAMHSAEPSWLEKMFSTHPPTTERIQKARAKIASLPPKSGLMKDGPRFHEIQQRLPAIKEKE